MISEKGRVLELLLSGQFICRTTDEDAYRYLKVSAQAEEIETHLGLLNRTLSVAADSEVFYSSYTDIGENERKILGQQFKEVSTSLLPLVEWLVLVQDASGQNSPLTEGNIVRLNELQSVIEDTPAFAEQLAKIARYALFNSVSNAVDAQLKQIFKRLVELGYLLKPNADKMIYVATGKVDYLFDVIKFIDDSENLNLVQQAEDVIKQGDLL